ncbi:MAG: hypothetical protein LBU17_03015 [Treponema sp.]|jgi:energy-coupling factor transporter ATP-binding protein EcfA2|nr:hypothetical protein [Treponema sp.]
MITLERIRLVEWHYFEDEVMDIGNRCLLGGDNGSGKSTIVDAIQYAMAADLRKARFNAAAGDRKGGRDLVGYVRCKLGSDTTEYLREDAVAHIMLEFSGPEVGAGFSAGVCVEAFTDGRLTEHFWIGVGIPLPSVAVRGQGNLPLLFRQFRDLIVARNAQVYESKKLYLREFTAKLGVWKRMAEYNPYLEAFTRSVSFTPLVSVDKFVCDYILEDRPVDISLMKENLESYKETDRQARGAVLRIEALKKISAKAKEWRNYLELILKQEYLKLKIERDMEEQKQRTLSRQLTDAEAKAAFLEKEIATLSAKRFEWDHERQETEASLAANDAHLLYMRVEERIGRLKLELEKELKQVERYELLRSQCERLLDRPLEENPEKDIQAVEEGERNSRAEKEAAQAQKNEAGMALQEALAELEELERGIPRYPEGPTTLRSTLEDEGIAAHFLADAAEVLDPNWADAVEGWLNTLRFALLVDPRKFQWALELYDSLPRSIAGVFLPNLEKMRGAKPKQGSLAELVKTTSPYARMYIDYSIGDVMCADIRSLKTFQRAITQECMTYSGHTASRIREDVYRRHYLGQAARKERKEFLLMEADRLRRERDNAALREQRAAEGEERFRRAYRALLEIAHLFPSVAASAALKEDLAQSEEELAAIDTRGFKELEDKKAALSLQIQEADKRLIQYSENIGGVHHTITSYQKALEAVASALELREQAIRAFGEAHPAELGNCETYSKEKIGKSSIQELSETYEATLKGFRSRVESLQREYHNLVQGYDRDFNALISVEPSESAEVDRLLNRLETSELPEYQEKIAQARRDAEREFKDHFIVRLHESIEEARESFREINETLRTLSFGRDQYRFSLEERSDRRGQLDIVKKAAEIPNLEDENLFEQFDNPAEFKAVQTLFDRILNANLDSPELRSICDYRTYFHYDIKIKDTEVIDQITNKPVELSLSKVLREKSGGEAQTPYYVAIAASFYRFYKSRPEETVRLVMFDEAFNRMDDERISKILEFYRQMNIQLISAVPSEKIEAIAPHMDRTNLIIRHGYSAFVRDFHHKS